MGTRSCIGIENSDGSIVASYCHWDGYVSHNGAILLAHYGSPELARAIASGGYYSFLGKTVEASLADAANVEDAMLFENDRDYFEVGNYVLYLFRNGEWLICNGGRYAPTNVKWYRVVDRLKAEN